MVRARRTARRRATITLPPGGILAYVLERESKDGTCRYIGMYKTKNGRYKSAVAT